MAKSKSSTAGHHNAYRHFQTELYANIRSKAFGEDIWSELLVCEDVTANVTKVAEARRSARERRSVDLCEIEGSPDYERQQEFLAVAARVAKEGRLSRFVHFSTRHEKKSLD